MSDMIERVRDAIEMAIHQAGGFEFMSADDGNSVARAAIEAMREPSDAMAEAIWHETGDPCWKENAVKAWKAGIDEALKPPSSTATIPE